MSYVRADFRNPSKWVCNTVATLGYWCGDKHNESMKINRGLKILFMDLPEAMISTDPGKGIEAPSPLGFLSSIRRWRRFNTWLMKDQNHYQDVIVISI
jgi:hypothetical protein